MHDVETVLIRHLDIGTIVDQLLAYFYIASERCVVNGSELVFVCLQVCPGGHFLAFKLLVCVLHEHVEALLLVLKNCHVQEREAITVN